MIDFKTNINDEDLFYSEKKRLNFSINAELAQEFKVYAKKNKVNMSNMIEVFMENVLLKEGIRELKQS